MKHRISISIDENTLFKIMDKLRSKEFRRQYKNKSNLIECAIKDFLEEN